MKTEAGETKIATTVSRPNKSLPKLRRLLGPHFAYRLNPDAPTQEERDEAVRLLPAAQAKEILKYMKDEAGN